MTDPEQLSNWTLADIAEDRRLGAYRDECVRFYGAASFWFSISDAPLASLRSAFDRVHDAEMAWLAARERAA